jgi:predicted Zn-dependent protease
VSGAVRIGAALAATAALACAGSAPHYEHSRYDYWAFRARTGQLPEPNYLPWITHWEHLPGGEPALVLCRWPDERFPLVYHVSPPTIPIDLQDEFRPRSAKAYVEAVHRAFGRWAEALGRPVRFEPVDDPSRADLGVRLEARLRDEGAGLVGGVAGEGRDHCRVTGTRDSRERVRIEFSIEDVQLFIADSVGLLTPRQVERLAMHEIGHVLGASGQHSPMRGDLMYSISDDSRVEVLSKHDRNTFRALYRLPPGTVYTRLGEVHDEPMVEALRRPPRLDRTVRDERFGFDVKFPVGWQQIRTARGWVAVDGLSWDYDATIQLIALRGTRDAYIAYHSRERRASGRDVIVGGLELDGQQITRIVAEDGEVTEETMILDWDEGWVLLVVADCRQRHFPLYQPWFRSVLLSLGRLEGGVAEKR